MKKGKISAERTADDDFLQVAQQQSAGST